jgi:hypothetical protein
LNDDTLIERILENGQEKVCQVIREYNVNLKEKRRSLENMEKLLDKSTEEIQEGLIRKT